MNKTDRSMLIREDDIQWHCQGHPTEAQEEEVFCQSSPAPEKKTKPMHYHSPECHA